MVFIITGFNDDLVRTIDPDATAYSRTSKNGETHVVFLDFTVHRVMPALSLEPCNVSVLRPKMLLREYVWNGLSTSGDGSSGVVVPLNYDMFDVRTSNLVKVHGLSSSKSFSAPASSDVPSVVRARVPWEFMPFGLKYCFNKAQSMEGFNQSKMIDPKTKHWYLSIKEDAGIDSVKVAKIEESLGACYRALVEFPGVGRFPPDSPPIDVFQTFAALSVRKGEQSKTFMVLMDDYYPAVFGNELTISTNGYAKCNVGHIHTMNHDAGVTVDHINRIPLDNRRKNLRVATTMSVHNGNRVSSVEIDPPEELKPYFDEMPAFLRWDRNYLRFVSDKYNINFTRSEKVSIVNKFRDAAVKLKTAIIEDIEYSRHLATLNQLRDDYIQINKLVHSLYPEHFDMYDDSTDKVYRGTPEFIEQCLVKLQAAKEGDVMIKSDASVDSVNVAKAEESLGACYRALVEFLGVGRFPHDSLPIDVFRLFNPVAGTLGVVAGGTEMVRVSDTIVSLLGDLVVSSNIVPMTNATQYLGTSTMHFKEAWIDELHISSNTLYIGDTPVLCADNDAVSIRADPGQGITLTTTGDGETSLVSAKEVNVVSEGGVTMRVSGPLGRVNIQSSGEGGTVNLGAEKEIVMTAPLTTISSNMIVKGDLTVEGTQLTVNTQTVTVEDNIIVLNSVKGDVTFNAGVNLFVNGADTQASPGYSWNGDANTGIYKDVVELVEDLVVVIEYVFAVHENSKRVAHVHHEVLKAVPQKIEEILSALGLALIMLQPIAAGFYINGARNALIYSAVYTVFLIFFFAYHAPFDFSTVVNSNGHLQWNWLNTSAIVTMLWTAFVLSAIWMSCKTTCIEKGMAQHQTGGRELGRGVTARTIEISNPSDATDTDTFKHIIVSALADVKKTKSRRAWILYVLDKKNQGMTRVKLTTSGEKEQFCSNVLNTKVSDKFVCKDLNSAAAFNEEIRTAELLFRNVSASGLAKATTFSSIPFKRFNVVGIDLGGKDILSRDSGFYVFSLRCSMSAASKGISSDANMDKFVRETLENFDVIHRAGIIHGDVKLDNMIYCAKDDRYRLIDWGKTADHADMVARYVDNTRFGFVNNTSSPMAWFCSGMNYAASLVFMTMIVTRHMERVAMCPPMRALVAHAYTSFNLAVRSILGGNPLFKLDKVTDKKLRLDILDRYAQSFDLYDIGLILTAFVCIYDDALSFRMRERALALAFRLVDYGDPSAHLSTARDALRWWIPVAAGVGGQRTTTIRDLVSKTSLVVAIVESLKAVSSASSAEVSSRLSTLIRTIEGIPRTTMLPDATKTALVDYSSSNAAVFSDVLARWKGFLDDKAASVKKIRDSAQKLKEVEVLINSFESTYSSFVSMSNPRSLGWGGVSPATSDASKNRMKVNMIGILNDITEKIGGIDDISIDPRDFSPAPDHIVMDDDVIFTQYQRRVRNLKASLLVANKELATALANADKPYKLRDITERNGGSNKESGDIYQLLSPDTFVSLVKEPLDATANLVRDGTNKMKDELLTIVDRQNKTKGPAGGDNIGVLQQHIEDLTYIFEATKDLQYVGLLLDVDEVVSKLKKFLEVAKNKQGVMDRLKIEDLGSYKETTSSSADAPKSIFDEYNKTPSRTRNPMWIKKSGGLMHRRIDDEFLDTYVNQLSGFYEKISENKLLSGGIENAKGQLISRLSGLDKQASLDRTKNDGTMFLNMQSAREMKVAAYKSYISTLQNILNTFIEANTSFILEQHRDALAYVMYWDEKMQQNPEIGDELCRKLVTMYLETRDKIVDYINESVIQVIISDVDNTLVVTTNVTNGAMIVRLDEKQEKMVMKLFGNFIDWVEKKGNWIVDLHIRGTLSWVDVLMSQVFLLSYVIKVVRVFFMWMSLRPFDC
eukprot:gene2254-biopygen10766